MNDAISDGRTSADEYMSMGMRPDGSIMLRVQVLRWLAKALAVQFKIGGIPYGASYQRAVNHAPLRDRARELGGSGMASSAALGR